MTQSEGGTLSLAPDVAPHGPLAPQPYVVLALQCDRLGAPPSRHALAGVTVARLGRGEQRSVTRSARALELAVDDRWMSARHVELRRVGDGYVLRDAGSKNGTRVNGVQQTECALRDGDVIESGHVVWLFRAAWPAPVDGPADVEVAHDCAAGGVHGLATVVPAYAARLAELAQVARALIPVVLTGETGTGKEVLARAVHALSGRLGRLVAVNCAAIPDALVESELFGHRRGAFSGATADHLGVIRAAERGTLLLDEVADLPPPSQAALLRTLEQREVRPVGAAEPVLVDVRFVSATHQDLEALAAQGRFREDLLSRLAGFTFCVPALRERREDLGLLIHAVLAEVAPGRVEQCALAPAAARALFAHDFPRNVRELRRYLARAVALAPTGLIERAHLPDVFESATPPSPSPSLVARSGGSAPTVDELEALLVAHRGNVSEVARLRGVTRMQVHRWMKRLGLDPDAYR